MISTYDAFVIASTLALEVQKDEQAKKAGELANLLALDLSPKEVYEGTKQASEKMKCDWFLN